MIQIGNTVETVDLASDMEAYTLSSLQANTDYIVTVLTLYEGNVEGPVATAAFTLGGSIFFFIPSIRAESGVVKQTNDGNIFLVHFCLRYMSRTTLHTLCRLAI